MLSTMIEKWAYFFKNAQLTPETEVDKIVAGDIALHRAYEELNRFSWNEEELRTYDQIKKYEWSYNAAMDQKYDEGMEKANLETAFTLLTMGLNDDDIMKATKLTAEQLQRLKTKD